MRTSDGPDEIPLTRDSVVRRVIQHVAEHTGQRATELPPLYETLDPDVLDTIVTSAQRNDTSLSIRFTYAGHEVTIDQGAGVRCTQS